VELGQQKALLYEAMLHSHLQGEHMPQGTGEAEGRLSVVSQGWWALALLGRQQAALPNTACIPGCSSQ
jgi:hypothetical protein